ncbi:MAG TPA: methyltransferase domain-containing protein [Candidatus Binatia bacterium]
MSRTTSWNPATYARDARFVADLGQPLLELLAPKNGEIIMDLGCGDGALTEKIAQTVAVVGADASFAQARAAKERGLSIVVVDGHNLCFKRQFDAVFTNAALHWMQQPENVVEGVWRCLKTDGRFVGEFGGQGNVGTVRSALHQALRRRGIEPSALDPWYFPSAEDFSNLLIKSSFTVRSIEIIERPTQLPGELLDWLEIFAQPFTNAIDKDHRGSFLDEVCQRSVTALRNEDGRWTLDYVRLRFAAIKAEK